MTKTIFAAVALPFVLTLAACDSGAEVDGTDTTAMEAEAVEPMAVGTSDPVDDGMMAEEPMTDDMTTDPAMEPTMDEPVATPE